MVTPKPRASISPMSCIFALMLVSLGGNCLTFRAARKFRDLRSPEIERLDTFSELARVQDAYDQIVITIRFKNDTLRSYCVPKRVFGSADHVLLDYPECAETTGETLSPLPLLTCEEEDILASEKTDSIEPVKYNHNLELWIWTVSDRFACDALRDNCKMHRLYSAETCYRYNLKSENQLSRLRIEIPETRLVDVPTFRHWGRSAGWLALIPPAAIVDLLLLPAEAVLQLYLSLRYGPSED